LSTSGIRSLQRNSGSIAVALVVLGCALGASDDSAVCELRTKHLLLPIERADVSKLKGSFAEIHSGHPHEAVDILAPRNTPIHAADEGTIAKLFESKPGGHTIYEYDPTGRYCYYYAHLDHYAEGLRNGDRVARGQVIGYVGTSGDAPPGTPHLHFTIFELKEPNRWWKGRAIDPYLIFGPVAGGSDKTNVAIGAGGPSKTERRGVRVPCPRRP
jgi:murein DD-endopeptidase MepM/ murein hydrolase activator NlpD